MCLSAADSAGYTNPQESRFNSASSFYLKLGLFGKNQIVTLE